VGSTEVSQSAGLYWHFEQALRQYESDLGINVFGSGACCAMRRELFRDIPPTGDVDFTSPLDAALQGKLCIHQPEAIAYDEMPDSRANELKARIRMTSKNFKGTLERWGWNGIRKYPLKSLVILSHKYGRWITPFLLLTLLLSSVASLILSAGALVSALVMGQVAFYALGILGFFKLPVPGASTIYSFLLGNYGILLGVLKAISGKVASTYTPIRNNSR
jgi:cellulose synthase/poly-beta-1,6-N-acetylglucosamine synthase-like glycosyltransferase